MRLGWTPTRVDRAVTVAEVERALDGALDEGLRLLDRLQQRQPAGNAGRDRRREHAAAAMGVAGRHLRAGQLDQPGSVAEEVERVAGVAAFEYDRRRSQRLQVFRSPP